MIPTVAMDSPWLGAVKNTGNSPHTAVSPSLTTKPACDSATKANRVVGIVDGGSWRVPTTDAAGRIARRRRPKINLTEKGPV